MIKDLNVRPETIEVLEENQEYTLWHQSWRWFFLLDPQSTNKHVRLQQTKKLCTAKENHRTYRGKYRMGENICKPYTW